jgi:pimeloyl-ACP methyl ester carboxylesterase
MVQGSSSIWFKQVRILKNAIMYFIDLRGHGNSKSLKRLSNKIIPFGSANDILEVLDFLKIEKSHFVGFLLRFLLGN